MTRSPVPPASGGDPRYSAGVSGTAPDGRMNAPSAERNLASITTELTGLFAGRSGRLLEIGSGSGQHAAHMAQALPAITWIPSDPAELHRRSTDAWRAHLGPGNMDPALDLDAMSDWWVLPRIAEAPIEGIFSANVIHIARWTVAQGIMRGAGKVLASDGMVILYGPFREGGAHTAESNAKFDAWLKARDPDWGVRDLDDLTALAIGAGLSAPEVRVMPSNNRLVIFRR